MSKWFNKAIAKLQQALAASQLTSSAKEAAEGVLLKVGAIIDLPTNICGNDRNGFLLEAGGFVSDGIIDIEWYQPDFYASAEIHHDGTIEYFGTPTGGVEELSEAAFFEYVRAAGKADLE